MCVRFGALQINWHIFHFDCIYNIFPIITTFSPNWVIRLVFSGMNHQILAIGTFLGTVILNDKVYIPEVRKYIKLVHPLWLLMFLATQLLLKLIVSSINSVRDSVARIKSDLCGDEDLSFMTYSELQFFFLRVEADKFSALCHDSHVSYLYTVYIAPPSV